MKKLCTIALLALLGFACDTQYFNPIPDARVLLNIDLATIDFALSALNSNKSFTVPRNVSERVGFGGVLVFHGTENGFDKYYAYDMACPNEASPSTKVAVESTLFARCPKCKSKFEIYAGFGNPVEGPAKYPLKRYNGVNMSGTNVTIYN